MAIDQPDKSKKRRIKNPESFRERALKTASEQKQPKSSNKVIKAPIKWLSKLLSPVSKAFKKLKTIKQLKPLYKVFRFLGKIFLIKYVSSSFQELKKVTWPSFKQSLRLTYAVLIFAIVFGASVAIADWGLGKIFKNLLLK